MQRFSVLVELSTQFVDVVKTVLLRLVEMRIEKFWAGVPSDAAIPRLIWPVELRVTFVIGIARGSELQFSAVVRDGRRERRVNDIDTAEKQWLVRNMLLDEVKECPSCKCSTYNNTTPNKVQK